MRKDTHHESHRDSYKSDVATASKAHIHRRKMAHMVGVAEYMRDRADDYGIDGNVAYTSGLLHDIGYLEGRVGHEEIGAEILEACGMHGDVVFAVANHVQNLNEIPKAQVSPLLVLMVEADLSIDMNGFRVGFEDRLKDIAGRYGTENNEVWESVKANVEYIKNYQQEHGIPTQDAALHVSFAKEHNHGSGKWVGSQTKKEIMEAYNRDKEDNDNKEFE